MLINIQTQEQIDDYQFRLAHKETSFPNKLEDHNVSSYGYAVINYEYQQEAQLGYKTVSDGVEQRDGKWYAKYKEIPLTQEEILFIAEESSRVVVQEEIDPNQTEATDVPTFITAVTTQGWPNDNNN